MTYEDFCSASDAKTYKRIKRMSMNLSRVGRSVVHDMVGGTLTQEDDSKKEYLTTPHGCYRLAMGPNADNKTELREHDRLGAKVVVMGDYDQMVDFFNLHGMYGPWAAQDMKSRIRYRIDQIDRGEEDVAGPVD